MILVPLDAYGYKPLSERQTVGVELAEEGYGVVLSVDFEPNEFMNPPTTLPQGPARDVSRSLLPAEARAIAAALVHFADEAERPR